MRARSAVFASRTHSIHTKWQVDKPPMADMMPACCAYICNIFCVNSLVQFQWHKKRQKLQTPENEAKSPQSLHFRHHCLRHSNHYLSKNPLKGGDAMESASGATLEFLSLNRFLRTSATLSLAYPSSSPYVRKMNHSGDSMEYQEPQNNIS